MVSPEVRCEGILDGETQRGQAPWGVIVLWKRYAPVGGKKRAPEIFRSPCVEETLASVDLELVVYREDSRYAVRLHAGDDLVAFVVHVTQQRDVPVFHDDADWRVHSQGVTLHARITIDAAVKLRPKACIEERDRKHLDLIIYVLDALDSLRRLARLVLHDRLSDLAGQRHRPAGIDGERHVVEHVAVGQHVQFMPYLLFNSCGPPLLRGRGALDNKGRD